MKCVYYVFLISMLFVELHKHLLTVSSWRLIYDKKYTIPSKVYRLKEVDAR